jgi:hypothetical protein
VKTPCGENSDLPTNTESFGRAQILNHFATVRPHQTIVDNQKVIVVYNKWETMIPPMKSLALNELN